MSQNFRLKAVRAAGGQSCTAKPQQMEQVEFQLKPGSNERNAGTETTAEEQGTQ